MKRMVVYQLVCDVGAKPPMFSYPEALTPDAGIGTAPGNATMETSCNDMRRFKMTSCSCITGARLEHICAHRLARTTRVRDCPVALHMLGGRRIGQLPRMSDSSLFMHQQM